ncbi:MAG: hypothetical protein J6B01_13035, partial [Ruminococcus sp.]|nr:hypothetical protein [Ruminococcus sp.]
MTSKTPARKCEDVDQQALTYSEIKALCTGDEHIKEKLMLENEVKELRVLSAEHNNTVYEMQDNVKAFPTEEKVLTTILKATPHKDRLTALHIICLHIFRHITQKLLAIRQYACVVFMRSDEKSDCASAAQSLCGVA